MNECSLAAVVLLMGCIMNLDSHEVLCEFFRMVSDAHLSQCPEIMK